MYHVHIRSSDKSLYSDKPIVDFLVSVDDSTWYIIIIIIIIVVVVVPHLYIIITWDYRVYKIVVKNKRVWIISFVYYIFSTEFLYLNNIPIYTISIIIYCDVPLRVLCTYNFFMKRNEIKIKFNKKNARLLEKNCATQYLVPIVYRMIRQACSLLVLK